MAKSYLIDSNVLIDYASKKFELIIEERLDTIFNQSFNYSVISKIEVLGYNASQQALKDIEEFLSIGVTHYLNEEICRQTILIRRQILKAKLPDLVIASTALVNKYTLLTRNTEDFKNIPRLEIENPWLWSSQNK
jgi:predicted nucleic acid-binding protein